MSGFGAPESTLRPGAMLQAVPRAEVALGVAVGLSLGAPLFFRGLFFPREQFAFLIGIAALFVWSCLRWRQDWLRRFPPLAWAGSAWVILYAATVPVAADPGAAVGRAAVQAACLLVLLLAAAVAQRGRAAWLLVAMWLAAVGVSLVGILALAGLPVYPGAVEEGRLGATLQYPNALASLLAAAVPLGLGLMASCRWRVPRWFLYPAGLALQLVCFLASYSRAGGLVLLAALAVLLGTCGRPARPRLAVYLAAGALSLAVSLPLLSSVPGEPLKLLAACALGIGLFCGGSVAGEMWLSASRAIRRATGVGVVLGLALACGVWVAWALHQPVVVEHAVQEADGWKWCDETVGGLSSEAAYHLTLRVQATGGGAPFAWRVAVTTIEAEPAERQVLAQRQGGPTSGWEGLDLDFRPPEGVDRVRVVVMNYYAGTGARFADLAVWASEEGAHPIPVRLAGWKLGGGRLWERTRVLLGGLGKQQRWVLYRDALSMLRDHPWGAGGGGWAALYHTYQSYGYSSNEVHSHPLQAAVETGVLGLVLWGALWALWAVEARRVLRCARGSLWAGGIAAGVALGLHSLVDFSLSLPALSIWLWGLYGLTAGSAPVPRRVDPEGIVGPRGDSRASQRAVGRVGRAVARWCWVGGVVLILLGSDLLAAAQLEQQGFELRAGDPAGAIPSLSLACRLNPLSGSYRLQLGASLHRLAVQEGSLELAQQALEQAERAVALQGSSVGAHSLLAVAAITCGRWGRGLAEFERALSLGPFVASRYEDLACGHLLMGEKFAAGGSTDMAAAHFNKVLEVSERLAETAARVPAWVLQHDRLPATTPRLTLAAGEAHLLLGNWGAAGPALLSATRDPAYCEAAWLWLAVGRRFHGDIAGAEAALAQAGRSSGDVSQRLETMTALLRSMNP